MEKIYIIVILTLFILFFGRYAYWSWFQSNDFIRMTQNQRRKYRRTIIRFLPPAIMFNFLDNNPLLEIWMTRITSLLLIILSIFAMVVGIYGSS
jgi:hypothetical protein